MSENINTAVENKKVKKVTKRKHSNPFFEKLLNEPMVKVNGSEVYRQFCGDVYTFLYNGYCVSIKFNGEDQEFPETIAKALQRKLSAISKANTPRVINTKI